MIVSFRHIRCREHIRIIQYVKTTSQWQQLLNQLEISLKQHFQWKSLIQAFLFLMGLCTSYQCRLTARVLSLNLTETFLCQNKQYMLGSLLVQVCIWIINNTRCIFPETDCCNVLLLAQSLYVSFLIQPLGSQSLKFSNSSYLKGDRWTFWLLAA